MPRTKQTAHPRPPLSKNIEEGNPSIPIIHKCCGLTKTGSKCSKVLKSPNSFCNLHKNQIKISYDEEPKFDPSYEKSMCKNNEQKIF